MQKKKKLVDFLKENFFGKTDERDGVWYLSDERIIDVQISAGSSDVDMEELESYKSRFIPTIERRFLDYDDKPVIQLLYQRGNNLGKLGENLLSIDSARIHVSLNTAACGPIDFSPDDTELEAEIPANLNWSDIQNMADIVLGPSHPDFRYEGFILFVPDVSCDADLPFEPSLNVNPAFEGEGLYEFLQRECYHMSSGRFFSDRYIAFYILTSDDGNTSDITKVLRSLPATLTFQRTHCKRTYWLLIFKPEKDCYDLRQLAPNIYENENIDLLFASHLDPYIQISGWKVSQARKPALLTEDDVREADWALGNLS